MTELDSEGPVTDIMSERAAKDARLAPFSVQEQWGQVQVWYQYLLDREGREVAGGLMPSWDALSDAGLSPGGVPRGEALKEIGKSPFSVLFHFIDMGFYPPPELLLALMYTWETYLLAAGDMSLEEAFFGPARRGAGNFAKRSHSLHRKAHMALYFAQLVKEGKSRLEAAELVSARHNGKPDADSILRMLRGFPAGQQAEK